jgi:hypothetical protein
MTAGAAARKSGAQAHQQARRDQQAMGKIRARERRVADRAVAERCPA